MNGTFLHTHPKTEKACLRDDTHVIVDKKDYEAVMQFLQATIEMRESQKKYFKTRDGMILRLAKAKEKKVDDFIAKMGFEADNKQQSLF